MSQTALSEQRERLLGPVAVTFLAVMGGVAILDVALAVTSPMSRSVFWTDLVITFATALAAAAALEVARRGNYRAAPWLLVGAIATRLALAACVTGVRSYSVLAPSYLIAIVVAQVLISSRAGLLVGCASVLMAGVTYTRLQTDSRPDLAYGVPVIFSTSALLYLTVGGFVHIVMGRMDRALRRMNIALADNERARRELQESEEQFRALSESSPTGILIQQDGHLVYGNPRFAEMAHCVKRDIYGLSLWDFFSAQDANALRVQLSRRREQSGGTVTPDLLLFRPLKGEPPWCEVAVADAVYGNRAAIIANLLDVTERVQAQLAVTKERDFSNNIIHAADAIIMTLDNDGKLVTLNPAGERITGYAQHELVGTPVLEKLAPPDPHLPRVDFLSSVRAGQLRGQVEGVWISKGGEELIIAWRYVAQQGPQGEITGIIAIGIDVTQQRILERQSMATERLRALGQMAGGVAHDLNNTLTGILGPAELLLLEEDDPDKRRELSAIVAAARRGAETVRRIQRFSQSRTDMDRQVFDLRALADEVIYTLRPRWRDAAELHGITIRIVNDLPENLKIVGSAGEIGNVLTNLIVNACEAMPRGGTITISGERAGSVVRFSVTDTGIGMSEETLANVFQPFFSTKGADNSGLGLAVIRGIVLRHGGSIEVQSELGVGTTFTVSLPAASQVEQAPEPEVSRPQPAEKLCFLVVDDTPAIADFAGAALRKLGHEATVTYDGKAALAALAQTPFDVLLTDYGMEGISGVGLAQEALRLQPHIKLVLMTGWDASASDFEHFTATLPKPFTLAQLTQLIENLRTS